MTMRLPLLLMCGVMAAGGALCGAQSAQDQLTVDAKLNQDLVRLLPDLKAPKVDVFFVYPEELRNSKRVAVFRDFLLARLAEMP